MNISEMYFSGLNSAKRLYELAEKNFIAKKQEYLKQLTEEEVVEIWKNRFLNCIIYVAAVKEGIIEVMHESDQIDIFIDKDQVNKYFPMWGYAVIELSQDTDEPLDETYTLYVVKGNWQDRASYVLIELIDMKLENSDDWYCYYTYDIIGDYTFFAERLHEVFKKHEHEIVQHFIDEYEITEEHMSDLADGQLDLLKSKYKFIKE